MCAGALERGVSGWRAHRGGLRLAHPSQRKQSGGVTVWELPLANNPGKVDLPVLLQPGWRKNTA